MVDVISRTTEIMEWVGLFREIDEAETEKPRFCIFVESNPFNNFFQTGIADGFSTAEKAAKRSVKYYDFSVVEDVEKTAIHIGGSDELHLDKLGYISAFYYPEYVGKSKDGFSVIIGHFRMAQSAHIPDVNYSPYQIERAADWFSVLMLVKYRQNIIIARDLDAITDDVIITETFVDENGDIDRERLNPHISDIYIGCAGEMNANTINTLADWNMERIVCSKDDVFLLLGQEVFYG